MLMLSTRGGGYCDGAVLTVDGGRLMVSKAQLFTTTSDHGRVVRGQEDKTDLRRLLASTMVSACRTRLTPMTCLPRRLAGYGVWLGDLLTVKDLECIYMHQCG